MRSVQIRLKFLISKPSHRRICIDKTCSVELHGFSLRPFKILDINYTKKTTFQRIFEGELEYEEAFKKG